MMDVRDIMGQIATSPDGQKRVCAIAVCEAYVQQRYANLQELEATPPPYAFYFIKNKVDHFFTLAFLQDIETAPPAPAFDMILEKVKEEIILMNAAGSFPGPDPAIIFPGTGLFIPRFKM